MEAKQTALENAMRKIEKDFGKGAIMRLGDLADKMNLEVISSGSLAVDLAVGVAVIPAAVLSKFTARNLPVKQRWLCMPSLLHKKQAALRLLLMLNMRWIRCMPVISA